MTQPDRSPPGMEKPGPPGMGTGLLDLLGNDRNPNATGIPTSDNWPETKPLTQSQTGPAFPVDHLPVSLRAMVVAAAEALQVPVELTGALAISAVDIAMGGRFRVHLWGDWVEPCQLYVIPVCQPGTRKSATFQTMVATPIEAAEKQLQGELARTSARTLAMAEAARKALTEAQRTYAKDPNPTTQQAVVDAADEVTDAEEAVQPLPRLFTSDVTPQQLEILMQEHHGRMAIMAAESPLLANISGLYSGGTPQFDVMLAGHASDSGQRTDRVSRGAVAIDHPSLSLCLMVQPEVMTAMTGKPEFVGRGLVQRTLPVMADVKIGDRKTGPDVPGVPPPIRDPYHQMLTRLAHAAYRLEPTVLGLTPEAVTVFADLAATVEAEMRPGGEGRFCAYPLLVEWASKYTGAVARIAAVLHVATVGAGGGRISGATARSAVQIGEFFAGHAIAAFSETQAGITTATLRYLLKRVRALRLKEFTAATLARASRVKGTETKESIAPYLEELEELGWLRRAPAPARPAGSRARMPAALWQANPTLWDETGRIG